jgi:putative phosphoribosyl transferase
VLAVPVAPPDAVALLRREVDEVFCLAMPRPFYAIGFHYRDFHQVLDAEVVALLRAADAAAGAGEGKAAEGSMPAGPN